MPLPNPQKGDQVKAEDMRKVVDEIKRLGRWNVGPGLALRSTAAGLQLWLRNTDDLRIGKVKTTGPNGESDYTDGRYWLSRVYVSNTDTDPTSALTLDEYDSSDPHYQYVTATNLNEAGGGAHGLPAGSYVIYWEQTDLSTPTNKRYVFGGGGGGGSLPTAEFQYMSYVMVSQNQSGWDFIRSHALP